MKLLIASGIFHPEPGGPATYLREALPEFAARGWAIRVLTFSDPAHMAAEVPVGYDVTRIARTGLAARYLRYAAASLPLTRWAEVVYLQSLGLPLLSGGRAPRIVKIVGDAAWERAIRRGWIAPTTDIDAFQTMRSGSLAAEAAKAWRALEARRMDAVIVPSNYLKRMVIGWGVPPERVRVIYNALPPQHDELGLSQSEARAELGLDDRPTVLTVGRMLPWKGVDALIAALRRVPDVRLIAAGDGDALPALKASAADLGERVIFLGRVPNARAQLYMRAVDYVALYSGYEGLSHTLLESLRAGTPCIASDKGGNPEVVRHNVNGLLAPYTQNLDAAAEHLAAVLSQAFAPGVRARLAANSGVGMERFAFSRMIEETMQALTEQTQHRRGAAIPR
jgi:glycosyltransferase involved in cell wall biosynthesis